MYTYNKPHFRTKTNFVQKVVAQLLYTFYMAQYDHSIQLKSLIKYIESLSLQQKLNIMSLSTIIIVLSSFLSISTVFNIILQNQIGKLIEFQITYKLFFAHNSIGKQYTKHNVFFLLYNTIQLSHTLPTLHSYHTLQWILPQGPCKQMQCNVMQCYKCNVFGACDKHVMYVIHVTIVQYCTKERIRCVLYITYRCYCERKIVCKQFETMQAYLFFCGI
eukprot:TRINITY_DN6034_c2_g1_i2.p2 TRINITY_DN6034_c2_g1~~TRINITY_DN6034_c2_g1_i2.p2  ORF type:complete len:218 (-),score=-24.03 TRINITY_DN6034_c2_g1_i2:90-743(-)